jgi:undecaprenyl-diphosphatase
MVHIVNDRRGGAYGFPSCHAANSWGLTFFLMFLLRNRVHTILLSAWAISICYSRIYLGVHYPGDLLAGMFIGLFWGYLGYRVLAHFAGIDHGASNGIRIPLYVYLATVLVFLSVAFILV